MIYFVLGTAVGAVRHFECARRLFRVIFRLTLTTLMAIFPLVSGGMLRNELWHCNFSLQPGTHAAQGRNTKAGSLVVKIRRIGFAFQIPYGLYNAATSSEIIQDIHSSSFLCPK